MKLKSTMWIVALGLAAPCCALAQDASDAIVGEKGVVERSEAKPGKAGMVGDDAKARARLGVIGEERPQAQLQAVRSGALGPAGTPGIRAGNDNTGNNNGPKEPVNKDPKGPDKLVHTPALARLGQGVAMDPKEEPPKDKDPKDPKGPDKLDQALLRDEAVGTRDLDRATQTRAGQQATRAASQATGP